jgi:hypothetical protein
MRAGVVVGFVLVGALTTGCKTTDGSQFSPGSYQVRESGVALRGGGAACAARPGVGTCPDVLLGLRPGQRLFPICQRRGQTVGRNPYWLYADGPRGNRGWVASWYLTYPSNRLPGVPDCTAALLRRHPS